MIVICAKQNCAGNQKERKNMFAQLINLDISIPHMLQNQQQQQHSSER
jgi:hypothetical protein